MTNISIQSSHNGYLSAGLSPYVPLSTQHHQLHAAHHSIMPPPAQLNQNLDASSFQFATAYHPNGYSTIPMHPHARTDSLTNSTPLIAGYAPAALSSHQPPTQQLVSHQQWIPTHHHPNQLGHLHTINTMQPTHHTAAMRSSPTASNMTHQQIINFQHHSTIPTVSIVQNSAGNLVQQQQITSNLSRPNTPSPTSNNSSNNPQQIQSQNNNSNNQSINNANLAQLSTSNVSGGSNQATPQPSLTPNAIQHQSQNWYSNTHYSSTTPTPIPHPSLTTTPQQQTNLIPTNPNVTCQTNPSAAFSQAITFGYPPTGYIPTAGLMPAAPAHWQQPQNPYIYGNYCLYFVYQNYNLQNKHFEKNNASPQFIQMVNIIDK